MPRYGNDLILGTRRDNGEPLTLARDARGTHHYIVGATGTGKSKLLESMIRADILTAPRSGCGVLLLDPHGKLFDDVMGWVAAKDLRGWPIVPIDLRRADIVMSYNLLMSRSTGEPAVIVDNLLRGILHAWGQARTTETPRLARWLFTILITLYELQWTLADALVLLSNPSLRDVLSRRVSNPVARATWTMAVSMSEAEYLAQIESTVGRLSRFLGTALMRATLGQVGATLNFSKVLEEAQIVLVSLATAGTNVCEEDAKALGALMLSDLWTAAKWRGKPPEGKEHRPFYVYCDEFHTMLNPSIAQSLAEARGFGISMCLSHQYPSQLLDHGEEGRRIYGAVMANCRTKTVFQIEHPDDLPVLAMLLHRHEIDPDQIKHQHYTRKVVDHQLNYVTSSSQATSFSCGKTSSENKSKTTGITSTEGESHTHSSYRSSSSGGSTSAGSSKGADGEDEISTTSHSESESWNESESETYTDSDNRSEAKQISDSNGTSDGQTFNYSSSSSYSQTPMLFPVMGMEAMPPIFRPIDEQLFLTCQKIAAQPNRVCMVRVANSTLPVQIVTLAIKPGATTDEWTNYWTGEVLAELPYAVPIEKANAQLEERAVSQIDKLHFGEVHNADEIVPVRRRRRTA